MYVSQGCITVESIFFFFLDLLLASSADRRRKDENYGPVLDSLPDPPLQFLVGRVVQLLLALSPLQLRVHPPHHPLLHLSRDLRELESHVVCWWSTGRYATDGSTRSPTPIYNLAVLGPWVS